VTRLLEFLFGELDVRQVRANCDAENVRSAHLLERLGMAPDGPDARTWFKGRWGMERWYKMHREEPE
jgi:RimJ/RimL family protein N-acetyltransferase